MATKSYYWHDYETWGAKPSVDRASQFAGIRTDLDLNPIGKPLVIFAKPADDFLPQPGACMVTGISPQQALEEGVPEADFFRFIHDEMSQAGTCTLGYNSIRFDDEITRYGLYRNFYDPYEREYKNGNSRWDMIDVVRLTRALRPEGINWPLKDDGTTSFRLEDLTAANDIEHAGAHDALVDVHATIAIAKLVKQAQPKLFDFLFDNRNKQAVSNLLNVRSEQPVLHVSARYSARLGCIASVLPLAMHPTNRNSIIVYDLRADPSDLLNLTAEEIVKWMYTATADLPEGKSRIALKEVHINKAPVLAPMSTLSEAVREEWDLGLAREQLHLQTLLEARDSLQLKLAEIFSSRKFDKQMDPDRDLYGGFLSDADKNISAQIRGMAPKDLVGQHFNFETPKLQQLLLRYRARNWPELLTAKERDAWDEFRIQRIKNPQDKDLLSLGDFRKEVSLLAIDTRLSEQRRDVVDKLINWPEQIGL